MSGNWGKKIKKVLKIEVLFTFLVPPLNKGTPNWPKITEHSAERSVAVKDSGQYWIQITLLWNFTKFFLHTNIKSISRHDKYFVKFENKPVPARISYTPIFFLANHQIASQKLGIIIRKSLFNLWYNNWSLNMPSSGNVGCLRGEFYEVGGNYSSGGVWEVTEVTASYHIKNGVNTNWDWQFRRMDLKSTMVGNK